MKRKNILYFLLWVIFIFAFTSVNANAQTTFDVPSVLYPTIQAALLVATDGDTIRVAEEYDASTNGEQFPIWMKNGVSLVGAGAEVCTLEAGNGQTVIICNGIDENTTIEGFTITHISGTLGRGIECINSSPVIRNNIITGNSETFWWGGGGGILCTNSSDPTIENNLIEENTSDSGGGGISCEGFSSPTITKNTITGNSSTGGGGGIFCYNSSPTITENVITGNSSTGGGGGGGILCANYGSSPTIKNNFIEKNTTDSNGGGISLWEYSFPMIANNVIADNDAYDDTNGEGGGISCETSSPTIVNNTITGNNAAGDNGGGGIFCWNSSSLITNNIIAFNSVRGEYQAGGIYGGQTAIKPAITYNNIYGNNTPYDYVNCDLGDGNISFDPLFVFVDPVNPDNSDYHLQDGSPSIDSGDNLATQLPEFVIEFDIEGNPRIYPEDGSGIVDMGAYEFQGITQPEEIIVNIDIKPWSRRNLVNPKSRGVLPVAILGAEDFDVTNIDPETIRLSREGFDGIAPIRWRTLRMITLSKKDSYYCHFFDWDKYLDLRLKFKTQDLVKALELDELGGETVPLILTGQLKEKEGRTPIRGEDSIKVLKIKKYWKWWWWGK